ncbi:MAG: endonuclease MutS2, partial [Prevotella sp.]
MIYPKNFENKIGFDEVRAMLRAHCLSPLGKERVEAMAFSVDAKEINVLLEQVREYGRLLSEHDDFALGSFFDCRAALQRIRLQGAHLEEEELFDLRRSLDTIITLVAALSHNDQEKADLPAADEDGWRVEPKYEYPELHRLTEGIITFPSLMQRIDQILDQHGRIRDTASPELNDIRRELRRTEGSISKTLYSILHSAQSEGLVEKDVTPTLRDGRLVIPVAPGLKRKISGIVHDESASGRTVFIEPTEVVEANNRIRELESDERHEIIRILTELTKQVRP